MADEGLGWHLKRRLASETIETLINQQDTIGASIKQSLDASKRLEKEKKLENGATNVNQVIQASATYHDDFEFPPLRKPSSIRLLTIEPGPSSDPIRCTLDPADLDDNPEFRALSYCWEQGKSWSSSFSLDALSTNGTLSPEKLASLTSGTSGWLVDADETPRVIVCNGNVIKIKPNLYNALVQFRDPNQPVVYWIDALCIKQDDPGEKNIQIPLMGRIYSCAQSVQVWLGKCPAALSPAMREMLTTSRLSVDSSLPLSQKHSLGYFAVLYLFTRRWFSRIWILQEMCFGRELSFHFGEHELSPETVKAAFRVLAQNRLDAFAAMGISNLKQLLPTMQLRESIVGGHRLGIRQWLQTCKGRKSTDPRDLLFGGMALIDPDTLAIDQSIQLLPAGNGGGGGNDEESEKQQQQKQTLLWPRITVRSRASVPEVLLNLAACLLSQPEEGEGMQLLSIASRTRLDDTCDEYLDPLDSLETKGGLPSWYPNLSSRTSSMGDTFYNQGLRSFRACTSLSQTPKISADGKSLFLDAAPLGRIARPGNEEWMRSNAAFSGGMEAIMLHDRAVPYGFLEFVLSLPEEADDDDASVFEGLGRVMTAGGSAATAAGSQENNNNIGPSFTSLSSSSSSLLLRASLCQMLHDYITDLAKEMAKRKADGDGTQEDEQGNLKHSYKRGVGDWIGNKLKTLDGSHHSTLQKLGNVIDYVNAASDLNVKWDEAEFHYQSKEEERYEQVKKRWPEEPWVGGHVWEELPWIKDKTNQQGRRPPHPVKKSYSFPWKKAADDQQETTAAGSGVQHSSTWNTMTTTLRGTRSSSPGKQNAGADGRGWKKKMPMTMTTTTTTIGKSYSPFPWKSNNRSQINVCGEEEGGGGGESSPKYEEEKKIETANIDDDEEGMQQQQQEEEEEQKQETAAAATADEKEKEDHHHHHHYPPTKPIIETFHKMTGFRNIYSLVPFSSSPSSPSSHRRRNPLILAPYWVQESDVVMLVRGSSVPYIFTPYREAVRRKKERLRTRLSLSHQSDVLLEAAGEGKRNRTRKELEKEVEGLEKELLEEERGMDEEEGRGGKTGKGKWVLVGEAYVEGVMDGEMVEGGGGGGVEFGRVEVV